MNKIVTVSMVTVSMVTVSMIILAGLALLGGPTHGNTVYANQSEKEHCSDKYLPQDETRFHILPCDDIGILNNHGGQ
jgi:hypothetical protein